MALSLPSCIKSVDDVCDHEHTRCIKNGKTAGGKQRYKYIACGKTFLAHYCNNAFHPGINTWIASLLKEGCGKRNKARLTSVLAITVSKRILPIVRVLSRPPVFIGQEYEVDEMCTYIQTKQRPVWVVYASRKRTSEVIDFNVGSRTCKTLRKVLSTVLLSRCRVVCSDKLHHYRYLIPAVLHKTESYAHHIERMNLTLRTSLKRFGIRTICFSKKASLR